MTQRPEPKDLLLEAFDQFTKASGSLEAAYTQLQQRAERLSIELEDTNHRLVQNLEEKERVRNYLNAILESLPCGVLVVDLQGAVTICNPPAARLLGISTSPAESYTRPFEELLGAHPLAAHVAACLADAAYQRADLELQADPEGPVLAVSHSPMRNSTGDRAGVTFIIKDVTQIKQLEAQTKGAERLSAMGEMAVELAHEIRNPLASIELLASLLCKELPADTDPAAWAGHIRVGVRSLNTILSNMLHFTRDLTPTCHPIDLRELIEETLSFAEPLICARGVTVMKSYAPGLPIIPADRELLKQVFLNLIFNALQAMPDSGFLEVNLGHCAGPAGGDDGSMLEIQFKDTGMGIEPEHLGRIFDPYFTTSKTGNGLGLAVVHRIVENHRGRIQVESTVHFGTTFTIRLPLSERAGETPRAARQGGAG